MTASTNSELRWKVYVAPSIPTAITDLPPNLSQRMWSPISATLIYGGQDAVLVDSLMTTDQAENLARWVAATGKKLTTIYITHGHGDHWFGLGTILDAFPSARAVAVPTVVDRMKQQMAPEFIASFWAPRFPGQIPDSLAAAEVLTEPVIHLEDQELRIVELGHTDTDHTTCLHVPSASLVVAGDAVYNDVHLYLAESPHEQRDAWLRALDIIQSLHAKYVIAGHKRPDRDDDPGTISETRQYINDFESVAARTSTTLELYTAMLELHPDRLNLGALWGSARSAKGYSPSHVVEF